MIRTHQAPRRTGIVIPLLFAMTSLALLLPGLFGAIRPEYGGQIRIATLEPVELDPLRLPLSSDSHFVSLVFETLVVPSPTGALNPGLAEKWEWSEDKLHLRLSLAQATFSDGRPVTAAAVLSSLTRLQASPRSWLVSNLDLHRKASIEPAGNGSISNGGSVEPHVSSDALSSTERDESMHSDRQLLLRLHSPDPMTLFKLAHPATAITRRDSDGRLVGTGPFVISFVSQDRTRVLLSPNLLHRFGRPFLDRVEILVLGTIEAALRELERGESDISPVPLNQVNRFASGIPDLKLYSMKNLETVALLLNPAQLTEEHANWIRNHLDLASMIRFRLHGHGSMARTFEPWLASYVEEIPSPPSSDGASQPSQPLRLLAPRHLRLAHQLAERIRGDLSAHGATIAVQSVSSREFRKRLVEGNYDLALVFIRTLACPPLTFYDWARLFKQPFPDLSPRLSSWLVADDEFRSSPWIQPLFGIHVHYGAQARLVNLKWIPGGRPTLEQAWWSPRLDRPAR